MLIYFNRKPMGDIPYGGGNRFITRLKSDLEIRGHKVVCSIKDLPSNKVDLIIVFDPRENESFDVFRGTYFGKVSNKHSYLLKYSRLNQVPILQRVGDLGTHGKPDLTRMVEESIKLSDHIIFTSEWAKNYLNYEKENFSIIPNRSLRMFHAFKKKNYILGERPKIITHHWSNNLKKGFETYKKLDSCVNSLNWNFTYVGRLPNNFQFENSDVREPMTILELCKFLPQHDIYITASEEECGANHVVEAMALGLPIVYSSKGGSIVEYCKDYGVEYDGTFVDLIHAVKDVISSYSIYKEKILRYEDDGVNDIQRSINDFIDVMEAMTKKT